MKSIVNLLDLPEAFAGTLLILALILSIAPYLSGLDFGVLKIPSFPETQARRLKRIGPALFVLILVFFIPIFPAAEIDPKQPNATYPKEPTDMRSRTAPDQGGAHDSESTTVPEEIRELTHDNSSSQAMHSKARDLYVEACEGGEIKACARLGRIYGQGTNIERDYKEAAKYYKIACGGYDATSCYYLGDLYERGLGVEMDLHKAEDLYILACEAGEAKGCERKNSIALILRPQEQSGTLERVDGGSGQEGFKPKGTPTEKALPGRKPGTNPPTPIARPSFTSLLTGRAEYRVLVDGKIAPGTGFGVGIDDGRQLRTWLSEGVDYLKLEYPGYLTWAALFITVDGLAVSPPRPSMDFSLYRHLIVEMKGEVGGECVRISIMDSDDPYDGREPTKAILLDDDWNYYSIEISFFEARAPLSGSLAVEELYVLSMIRFPCQPDKDGPETVYLRNIKFVE